MVDLSRYAMELGHQARLRPTGKGDDVEVLWWSHRDKWESIGDFGGIILSLDEALDYVAEDPMGCFWI